MTPAALAYAEARTSYQGLVKQREDRELQLKRYKRTKSDALAAAGETFADAIARGQDAEFTVEDLPDVEKLQREISAISAQEPRALEVYKKAGREAARDTGASFRSEAEDLTQKIADGLAKVLPDILALSVIVRRAERPGGAPGDHAVAEAAYKAGLGIDHGVQPFNHGVLGGWLVNAYAGGAELPKWLLENEWFAHELRVRGVKVRTQKKSGRRAA
jgi:hypothetical protein